MKRVKCIIIVITNLMEDLSLEIESYMDFLWEVGDEPPTKDEEKSFEKLLNSDTDF